MDVSNIQKIDKNLKEINHEIDKGFQRMSTRKNMNGSDWDNRQKLVLERNQHESKIKEIFNNLERKRKYY